MGRTQATVLRREVAGLATLTLDAAASDVLDALLRGLFAPLDGYATTAEALAIATTGTLPDGRPCGLAPALMGGGTGSNMPPDVLPDVSPGARLALRDAEGVPLAVVTVTESVGGLLAGPVEGIALPAHPNHRDLRRTADEVRRELAGQRATVVVAARALHAPDLARLRAAARPLVLVSAPPAGADPDPLVAAHRAAAQLLRDDGGALMHLLAPRPEPRPGRAAPGDLADRVLAATLGGTLVPLARADVDAEVVERLRAGDHVAEDLSPPDVVAALARSVPSRLRQGVVLLFTGLSGSGKSTVGALVAARLSEHGLRPVTLLDGDVVRTHLSAGLGFSPADRDVNVRRIGWVAAQLARHGGLVVAAPIAPYAAARRAVRSMVTHAGGAYVEVHVATPLAVCEARDRKGLYARARAGELRDFTGIDDPYDTPEHPDLRLDTSTGTAEQAAERVLTLLLERGHVDREVLDASPPPAENQ